MIERGQHLRFTPEARQPFRVARHGVGQDLDRHITVELRIAGAIDLAHATGANGIDDLERANP